MHLAAARVNSRHTAPRVPTTGSARRRGRPPAGDRAWWAPAGDHAPHPRRYPRAAVGRDAPAPRRVGGRTAAGCSATTAGGAPRPRRGGRGRYASSWTASLQLERWQEGALVELGFRDETRVDRVTHAEIVRHAPLERRPPPPGHAHRPHRHAQRRRGLLGVATTPPSACRRCAASARVAAAAEPAAVAVAARRARGGAARAADRHELHRRPPRLGPAAVRGRRRRPRVPRRRQRARRRRERGADGGGAVTTKREYDVAQLRPATAVRLQALRAAGGRRLGRRQRDHVREHADRRDDGGPAAHRARRRRGRARRSRSRCPSGRAAAPPSSYRSSGARARRRRGSR